MNATNSGRYAILSPCGQYRYLLGRSWLNGSGMAESFRPMVFVMLNPSTADAEQDDPTITRCLGFARREGCNGIEVVNLFAYRSTDPQRLTAVEDPVGPLNDAHIEEVCRKHSGSTFVAAWSAELAKFKRPALTHRPFRVLRILRDHGIQPVCLGTSKDGAPRHPLYIKADQPLIPYGS